MTLIALKALLYALEVEYVDPAGTTNSKEHAETMERYGIDKHTTSAYLITLKRLNSS